ncbi:GDP-fucose transporter 1, partial [Trichinella sp. T9]
LLFHKNEIYNNAFQESILKNRIEMGNPKIHKSGCDLSVSSKIVLVVCAYWCTSITLVFLNKYLLSSPSLQLNAPLFITWFQCVVSFMLCFLLCTYGGRIFSPVAFEKFTFDINKAKQILPLSLIFVGMVSTNNLCLQYVSVAFYYIGRSTTIIFNVIFSYLILNSVSSCKVLFCCGMIVSGFLLGVNQESVHGTLSYIGVFFGVLSTVFIALNAIYTKKMLPAVDNSSWQLSLYNSFNSSLLFLPGILLAGELKHIVDFPLLYSTKFWLFMIISGLFGFLISYISVLQVKLTSPLTHNVSATAKSAFQTVLAVIVYQEWKDLLWWTSNVVVLVSSMAYSYVRHQEMHKQKVQS